MHQEKGSQNSFNESVILKSTKLIAIQNISKLSLYCYEEIHQHTPTICFVIKLDRKIHRQIR